MKSSAFPLRRSSLLMAAAIFSLAFVSAADAAVPPAPVERARVVAPIDMPRDPRPEFLPEDTRQLHLAVLEAKQMIDSLRRAQADLTAELNATRSENQELRAQAARASDAARAAHQDVAKLQAEAASLRQDVAMIRSRVGTMRTDLDRSPPVRTSDLTSLRQEVAALRRENADIRGRVSATNGGDAAASADIAALRRQLDQIVSSQYATNTSLSSAQRDMWKAIDVLRTGNPAAVAVLPKASNGELAQLQGRLDRLEKQSAQALQSNAELAQSGQLALVQRIERLEAGLAQPPVSDADVKVQLAQLRAAVDDMKKQADARPLVIPSASPAPALAMTTTEQRTSAEPSCQALKSGQRAAWTDVVTRMLPGWTFDEYSAKQGIVWMRNGANSEGFRTGPFLEKIGC